MSGLIQISPSCTRFTLEAMWRNGQRIHPAYRSARFERVEGVGPPRLVTARQQPPDWLQPLDIDINYRAIPEFLREGLSPAKVGKGGLTSLPVSQPKAAPKHCTAKVMPAPAATHISCPTRFTNRFDNFASESNRLHSARASAPFTESRTPSRPRPCNESVTVPSTSPALNSAKATSSSLPCRLQWKSIGSSPKATLPSRSYICCRGLIRTEVLLCLVIGMVIGQLIWKFWLAPTT